MNIMMRNALKEISKKTLSFQEDTKQVYIKEFEPKDDFIAFQGHFPSKAVLPAIVQIMMAQLTIEEILQKECDFEDILNAKFSTPIEPNEKVQAKVYLFKENIWQCQISSKELSAQFRLKYK